MVVGFLADSDFSSDREEFGATGIDTSQIQLVQDPSVCPALNQKYGDLDNDVRNVVYYRASDRYFVAVPFDPSREGNVMGIEFLYVLDESLNELQTYGW